jgi:hypothetical protein
MGDFMRLWLNVAAAGTIFLVAILPARADARALAVFTGLHGGGGRVSAHPASTARLARTLHPGFRRGWAFASSAGYGLPWGYGGYDQGDPGQGAGVPEGLPPPPWLYGYGLPPHQACFQPRLIMIGKPMPKSHLPHIVYGSPPPCGYNGT